MKLNDNAKKLFFRCMTGAQALSAGQRFSPFGQKNGPGAPRQIFILLLMAGMLAACSSSGRRAPVVERSEAARKHVVVPAKSVRESDSRPQVHVVQRGETLYSIAFNYGLDYRDVAEWNGIQNPGVISTGQEIRLYPGGAPVVARSGIAGENPRSAPYSGGRVSMDNGRPVESLVPESLVKEQPRVVKYPYSELAMAQIDKVQEPANPVASIPVASVPVNKAPVNSIESRPDEQPESATDDGGEDSLEWIMPAQGRVIAEFSESANRKGIDIAGKLGQPIVASAPGKVVYSGSGLRGYGKLVIIKHDSNYLSAYAHNDQVLVKEGQTVTRGQKIAEMGNTDTDQVKLHFEVRYHGKPVDPAKYLPL